MAANWDDVKPIAFAEIPDCDDRRGIAVLYTNLVWLANTVYVGVAAVLTILNV